MDSSPSKAATAPTDFPQLQTFSNEQLQELLLNQEAFQKLADSLIEDSQPMHVSVGLKIFPCKTIFIEACLPPKKKNFPLPLETDPFA